MYIAVNPPRHISTNGGILLLTASHMISQFLKCTVSLPHLLMHLHIPQICSLLLFWQPIIPLTLLPASIGPYLKQQQVGYSQILSIFVTENPILRVTLRLLP